MDWCRRSILPGSVRITDLIRNGERLFSFEFFPPRDEEGMNRLLSTIEDLKPYRPGYVSVTYGAGGSTRPLTVDLVKRIKNEVGIETMAHLTCVGADRSEIAGVLDELAEGGIENILALRGDPPLGEAEFRPVAGGFRHASDLVAFIKDRYPFSVGAACYPEKHPEASSIHEDLVNLKLKVDAGAEFLVTQLFFDPRDYFAFVERAFEYGIEVPVIPGIMPVTNLKQLVRFTSNCGATIPPQLREALEETGGDPDRIQAIGVAHAVEQCSRLLDGGAPGIHFYTLNRSKATRLVIDELR